MKKQYLFQFLVFALIVTKSTAQSTMSLSEAIKAAISNRKNIQASKIDVEIQQLKTRALYIKYGPQVSAEYNYNYNPILQTSIIPIGKFNPSLPSDATERVQFGTTWSQAAGITATQPLLDATLKKQINENRLQERINRASQAQSEYELAYEVAKSYINVGLQQEQITAAIIDTSRTRVSYQLQFENFTAGRLLKLELNTAIINHNNTKQKLTEATLQLVEDKIYLMYVTGTLSSDASDFSIDTTFLNSNSLLMADSKVILDNIPVFQQLGLQKQLSLLQEKSERSKYVPIVSIKGFLGANQFSNDFNPVKQNSWFGYSYIGLNVKFPILLGEDKSSKIKQLGLQSKKYGIQIEDKTAQFNQEAINAKLELSRLQTQLKTQEINMILYQENLKLLQDRFKAGQITSSELNRQEYELQKLLIEYRNTKVNTWLFGLSYLSSTGQLNNLWR